MGAVNIQQVHVKHSGPSTHSHTRQAQGSHLLDPTTQPPPPSPHLPEPRHQDMHLTPDPTADEAQAGLEAVATALQTELVVHLGVDVLEGGQGGATRMTVVPDRKSTRLNSSH